MTDERRINIRVPASTFEAWDNARHRARTSWQELGITFFSRWFTSEQEREARAEKAATDGALSPGEQALNVIEQARKQQEADYALALLAWLRNPRLEAQKPFGQFVLEEFERERKRGK